MYQDMYTLIKDVDILITDYSSIYFDYLLLRKPVILAPFDYKDYMASSRDFYFDYDTTIQGVRAYNWQELSQIIREKRYYFPAYALNALHFHKDGQSTKRIVDAVIKDSESFNI
jgi:CDP-glycerol glycerophosphotransferase